jgi:hypothetical protein
MHEPAKAVIALALSTAAAVWLLGVALHLWPDADQLAYGNPLPYLKVRMDSGVVRFWVEDFGGAALRAGLALRQRTARRVGRPRHRRRREVRRRGGRRG